MSAKDKLKYESLWRKNYEAISASGWAAASVACGVTGLTLDQPIAPFLAGSVAMGVMTAVRGIPAYQHFRSVKSLSSTPELLFISEHQVLESVKSDPDKICLGEGFSWAQIHTQRVHEITKRGMSTELDQKNTKRGSPWLHTVEPHRKKVRIRYEDLEGHTIIIGTTGSGKTRLMEHLILQAGMRNQADGYSPIIIVDPKSDEGLRMLGQHICNLRGQPEKFAMLHPAFPQFSVRMNPMKNFGRATEVASRIKAIMQTQSGDQFAAFQWSVVNTIVYAILYCENNPSVYRIRGYVERGVDDLSYKCLSRHLDRKYDSEEGRKRAVTLRQKVESEALKKDYSNSKKTEFFLSCVKELNENSGVEFDSEVDSILSLFLHDRDHLIKMIATLLPILTQLTAGELRTLLSAEPDDSDPRPLLDLRQVINEGYVFYIALDSLSDATVGSAIGSLLLAELASIAGDRYNFMENLKDKPKIYLYVDEIAEVVNQPLIQLLNKGRGAGFIITLATQCAIADLAVRMGSEDQARMVLGNCNNIISMRIRDRASQEFIVEAFEKTTIYTVTDTQSLGSSTESDTHAFSASSGERLGEVETDLIQPELLGKIPDLEYVAAIAGGKIIKGKLEIIELSAKPRMEDQLWLKNLKQVA